MSSWPTRPSAPSATAGLFEVFNFVIQAGGVDVGFLSGAQVDRYGSINSASIGLDPRRRQVRFPGSGGACDIACLAARTIFIAKHGKRRLPEKVDHITNPGWLEGGDSRAHAGLVRGGPSSVVTTQGAMRFRPATRAIYLAGYHPGLTPQKAAENTGIPLDVDGAVETPTPTSEEVHTLRQIVDPERVFLT